VSNIIATVLPKVNGHLCGAIYTGILGPVTYCIASRFRKLSGPLLPVVERVAHATHKGVFYTSFLIRLSESPMRPKLLKSFIVVLMFWMLATTMYWSLATPDINLKALKTLKELLPFLPFTVPQGDASILGSLAVQLKVIGYWTAPVLVLALVSGGIGYGLVWRMAHRTSQERTDRETGNGNFRGVTLTLGVLPTPKQLPRDDIDLGADDNEMLGRITEKERRLLCDILGTISAAPNAYPGEGITVPLLDHTLNLTAKALTARRNPGLSAIVAAAHELGKLTAYRKGENGEWSATKPHDREASRILGTLDSWAALPQLDRDSVLMAVKFHSNARSIPDLNGDPNVYRFARELLTVADDVQAEAVIEEKQRTLEKTELPDVIFESFVRALPSLSFQSSGLPKGVQAVAWKVGGRVYMLEIKLRETVLAKMPADVRGALLPNPKERQRVQPFTQELLKALEARGWLVRKIDDTKIEAKDALWNIKAGKLDFKGVIVIDVPKDFLGQLPSEDSMYEVAVTGPLFTSSSNHGHNGSGSSAGAPMGLSKNDLMGSVLKPSTPKPDESV